MSGIFSVRPAPEPGWAVIRVAGEAARLAQRQSMVLRVPEMSNRSFPVSQVSCDGDDLTMLVGPEVTDHLEAQTPYTLILPDAGLSGSVVWPAIQPPRAGARGVIDLPGAKVPPPLVAPVPEFRSETPEDEAVGPGPGRPVARGWQRALLGAAALLTILVLAWLAWWVFLRPADLAVSSLTPPIAPAAPSGEGPPTMPLSATPPVATPPAATPPVASPPIAAGMPAAPDVASSSTPSAQVGSQAAGLAALSVPAVIAQAGSPVAIDREAERRLGAGRPDDGLLLLEAAASQGNAHAMARLAKLYDPDGFDAKGPIPSPDIRESARYYRDAAKAGAGEVEAPRAKLHDTLEAAADKGDLASELALRDFWP